MVSANPLVVRAALHWCNFLATFIIRKNVGIYAIPHVDACVLTGKLPAMLNDDHQHRATRVVSVDLLRLCTRFLTLDQSTGWLANQVV